MRIELGNVRKSLRRIAIGRNVEAMRRGLVSADFPLADVSTFGIYRTTTVVLDCEVDGLRMAFYVAVGGRTATLAVVGRNVVASRVLRNAFIGTGYKVRNGRKRTVLGTWRIWPDRQHSIHKIVAAMNSTMEFISTLPGELHPGRPLRRTDALTYWWDSKANFGDAIGPWLVSKMTGLQPVNSRWVTGDGPALFTVGSVVGHLNSPGNHIWGSGLIGMPGKAKLNELRNVPPAKIHAVRGKLTRGVHIRELGWDVPEVYGDPALLLPRYYEPNEAGGAARIALVPHYKHKKALRVWASSSSTTVDVASGLERVIDQITGSSSVVSTSLHGIIIAQAYGIPWVWVRLEDNQLGGDDFKFEDFFSLLARDEVVSVDVTPEELGTVDVQEIAKRARLPKSFYDLDGLEDSFPAHLFSSAHDRSAAS